MGIKATIAGMEEELTAWRRDIHAHPELGFKEHRTADFVAQKLEEFGVQVFRDIGKTGLVGVLREGNDTQSVGLRADLDALPIQEENAFDHKSTHDGTMHACGHDGHTTMLLGAAKYLAETRNFKGQVNFIFQPAEEGIGGAKAMIEDGLFEQFPCDQLFAIHNAPGIPVGKFGASPGIVTAAGAFLTSILPDRAPTALSRRIQSIRWYWRPKSSIRCKQLCRETSNLWTLLCCR